jgi:hypothetical protein
VVGPPALGEDRWRHALLIDSGWREVAHTALGFISGSSIRTTDGWRGRR